VNLATGSDVHDEPSTLDRVIDEAMETYRRTEGTRLQKAFAATRVLGRNLSLLFGGADLAARDPMDEVVSDVEEEMREEPVEEVAEDPQAIERELQGSADADFLTRVRTLAGHRSVSLERELAANKVREDLLFNALLVAGFITAVLAVVGIALALAGVVAVAVVSGAVAILPGAGTALLARLLSDVRAAGMNLVERQSKSEMGAQEVEAIFAIESPEERGRQIALHAEALRQRQT
jgi:hypothetical protein